MNHIDFPPFPAMGERGPQVCVSVRFYLAIVDDLPLEQVRILSAHIQECVQCAAEFSILQHTTHLVAALPESAPSARVDEAILTTLHRQAGKQQVFVQLHPKSRAAAREAPGKKHRSVSWRKAAALAAALLLLVLTGALLRGLIFPASNSMAFQLPANLTWSGYVLHYTQTRDDTQGKSYQVEVYQDLGTNQMHIESTMPGHFDVVVVTDASTMLGKDMMHRVAQMGSGVEAWVVDGSLFDLSLLRQDLDAHRAVYLGKGTFQGQKVYQVRASNGQILLLDMHYLPVTALRDVTGSSAGTQIYNTCNLMSSRQVSDSMWDMQVPPDFRMGELPSRS